MKPGVACLLVLLSGTGAVEWTKAAESRPLARVDEAEVLLFQGATLEASVHAAGLLSVACVALEVPAVTRRGKGFHVVLAETVMDDDQVCMSLAVVSPFDVSVPLDLGGLPAGEYRVFVNDLVLDFSLEQNQP